MIPKSGNRFSDQVMHSEEKALSAAEIIRMLGLRPHPEGGHFTETHRDDRAAGRAHSTAIYFLLARGERSHWHRVDATEVWHYYAGAALRLETAASSNDPVERVTLGPNLAAGERPQAIVPPHVWQAAESLGDWTLVGCTVAPGFEFEGFELAPKGWAPSRT
jgi:predicted cupin superfamily sugar epimerase